MTLARAASALLSLPGRLAHAVVPRNHPPGPHVQNLCTTSRTT